MSRAGCIFIWLPPPPQASSNLAARKLLYTQSSSCAPPTALQTTFPHILTRLFNKKKKMNKTLWQGKVGTSRRRAGSHSRLIGRINLSRTAAVEPAAPLRLALDIFLVFTPKSAGSLSQGAEALKLQPFKTKRTKYRAKSKKKKNPQKIRFFKMSFIHFGTEASLLLLLCRLQALLSLHSESEGTLSFFS